MGIIKQTFQKCHTHAKEQGVCTLSVIWDYLYARVKHGFCGEDYFLNTSGYAMKNFQRKSFLSHKRWLQVRRIFNDAVYTHILQNKIETLTHFSTYIKHGWLDPSKASFDEFMDFVKSHKEILIKPICDEGGNGIHLYASSTSLHSDYQKFNKKGGGYLLEQCIRQHPAMSFNNKSVNTIRVYSLMDNKGKVHILKTTLRAGVGNSIVDNFHSGGVIYPINVDGGFVEQYGEQRENKNKVFIHPGSDIMMLGYKIPNWELMINTVKEMAKLIPQVRYIGWDMVITEDGVDLIEANDNADHALFGRFGIEKLFYNQIMQYK